MRELLSLSPIFLLSFFINTPSQAQFLEKLKGKASEVVSVSISDTQRWLTVQRNDNRQNGVGIYNHGHCLKLLN